MLSLDLHFPRHRLTSGLRVNLRRALCVTACLLALSSCGVSPSTRIVQDSDLQKVGKSSPLRSANGLLSINSLLLVPMEFSAASAAKSLQGYSVEAIEDSLEQSFRAATNLEVQPLSGLKGVSKGALSGGIEAQLLEARKNKIDGLLIAELQSFADRTGSSFGTNQNAQFGVIVKVIEASSGAQVWEGSYYEQDSAAQLVSVTGGEIKIPKFRSVESLMSEGFGKLGADFASARLKTYLIK